MKKEDALKAAAAIERNKMREVFAEDASTPSPSRVRVTAKRLLRKARKK